jgi:hypothetical protein
MIPSRELGLYDLQIPCRGMISKAFYGRAEGPDHSQATAHSSYLEFLDRELDRALAKAMLR